MVNYKEGEGTHISVYINIMPGEYDDALEWPLRADFFVYLMNQLEDIMIIIKGEFLLMTIHQIIIHI